VATSAFPAEQRLEETLASFQFPDIQPPTETPKVARRGGGAALLNAF
jgi:hypothetical protein